MAEGGALKMEQRPRRPLLEEQGPGQGAPWLGRGPLRPHGTGPEPQGKGRLIPRSGMQAPMSLSFSREQLGRMESGFPVPLSLASEPCPVPGMRNAFSPCLLEKPDKRMVNESSPIPNAQQALNCIPLLAFFFLSRSKQRCGYQVHCSS